MYRFVSTLLDEVTEIKEYAEMCLVGSIRYMLWLLNFFIFYAVLLGYVGFAKSYRCFYRSMSFLSNFQIWFQTILLNVYSTLMPSRTVHGQLLIKVKRFGTVLWAFFSSLITLKKLGVVLSKRKDGFEGLLKKLSTSAWLILKRWVSGLSSTISDGEEKKRQPESRKSPLRGSAFKEKRMKLYRFMVTFIALTSFIIKRFVWLIIFFFFYSGL